MKRVLIFAIILLTISFILDGITKDNLEIPRTAIRFRILANSNTEEDQMIKEEVSKVVQKEISQKLTDVDNVQEAELTLIKNLPKIEEKVSESLEEKKINYSYDIDYGYHHFPEKKFKGVTYNEGEYKSLLVTLGEGIGDNWWCILFPPLCLLEAEESVKEVEYKFFVQELIEKYF